MASKGFGLNQGWFFGGNPGGSPVGGSKNPTEILKISFFVGGNVLKYILSIGGSTDFNNVFQGRISNKLIIFPFSLQDIV